MQPPVKTIISQELEAHQKSIQRVIETMQEPLMHASSLITQTLQSGHKILLCGNGGSASDAQHIAAELTGRYKTSRQGLPAIALNTDTSALTAIANDFGYDQIFARQLQAIANEGDLLIAISTSGNSSNLLHALDVAKHLGCSTLGFLGKGGGEMLSRCDLSLLVPSNDTPRIQEMHILFGHILCHIVDETFKEREA
jgi:D-sedoheptulose 7-phosphate isomerase